MDFRLPFQFDSTVEFPRASSVAGENLNIYESRSVAFVVQLAPPRRSSPFPSPSQAICNIYYRAFRSFPPPVSRAP
jgi:hypothetical protein